MSSWESSAELRRHSILELSSDVPERIHSEEPWQVLHVKSRQEKALASDLEMLGISHYLPLVDKVTYYGARRFKVRIPLFPGYMFMQGARDEVIQADRTKRLVSVISVFDQDQLTWELQNIRMALDHGAELGPHRMLQKGWKVSVKSGPFMGLQGIIEECMPANRLILQVDLLGQAVSMEIDGDLLEILSTKTLV